MYVAPVEIKARRELSDVAIIGGADTEPSSEGEGGSNKVIKDVGVDGATVKQGGGGAEECAGSSSAEESTAEETRRNRIRANIAASFQRAAVKHLEVKHPEP